MEKSISRKLTPNHLSDILLDSLNNKAIFSELDFLFQADHVLHIRYIRKHKTNNLINYVGTLIENDIFNILKDAPIEHFPKLITKMSIYENHCSMTIKQDHNSYKDIFIFDIHEDYLNSLSQIERFELHQRLLLIINLLYLKISLKVCIGKKQEMKKSKPRAPGTNKITSHLCEQFNITQQELLYLNSISLVGSSKEIARAVNKSPRTIEKIIQNLLTKLNIDNKNQLQVLAKIVNSHSQASKDKDILELII